MYDWALLLNSNPEINETTLDGTEESEEEGTQELENQDPYWKDMNYFTAVSLVSE